MTLRFGIPTKRKTKINGSVAIKAKAEENVVEPQSVLENKSYYSAKELCELDIKELPTLIDPLFIKAGLTVFAGSSDTGKSTFLRQFAMAIAKGDDNFLGWKINAEHNRVIYVSTEDDKYAISYLINKSLGDKSDIEYLDRINYVFDTENLESKLAKMLNDNPADCVIIDALTDLYGGDLNQSNKVRVFLNQYFNLSDKHNCLFIFLHHTGKRTEELAPSKNNLLGSQGIEGKARQVIELRRDPSDNNYRHLCIVKGNYLPDGMKEQSFKLKFDSDLTFKMTNKRVCFEQLARKTTSYSAKYDEMVPEIVRLKEEKSYTFQKITEALNEKGYSVGKTKVNELYNEAKGR